MITQQLYAKTLDMSGKLTIVAEPGQLTELWGLMEELKLRANVTTDGTITEGPSTIPDNNPPPEE